MTLNRIIGTSVPNVDLSLPDELLTRDQKISKESFTISKHAQSYYDSRGRKQFHGAFTGGFSAGYNNTVGSKEGFTPKTFTSRRKTSITGPPTQSVLDFMDEEDLEDFDIDSTHYSRRHQIGTESMATTDHINFLLHSSLQEQFVSNAANTIGYRLLKGMGWKENRPVGPIRYRIDQAESNNFDTKRPTTERTRSDTKLPSNINHRDYCGLGYMGMSFKSAAPFQLGKHSSNKISMALSFQDEDEADNPIFHSSPFTQVKVVELQDMEEDDMSIKRTSTTTKRKPTVAANPTPSATPFIPGFARAQSSIVSYSLPPVPRVPSGFVPQQSLSVESTRGTNYGALHGLITAKARINLLEHAPQAQPSNTDKTGNSNLDRHLSSAKRERYDLFLSLLKGKSYNEAQGVPWHDFGFSRMELEEYEIKRKSTEKLSNIMAKRFVSERAYSQESQDSGAETSKMAIASHDSAAASGMFGRLTRRTELWLPTSLLCKRMGISNPSSKIPLSKKPSSSRNIATSEALAEMELPTRVPNSWKDINSSSKAGLAENSESFPPLAPKPPVELFKQIFETEVSDDDCEEDEAELLFSTTAFASKSSVSSQPVSVHNLKQSSCQDMTQNSSTVNSTSCRTSLSQLDLPSYEEGLTLPPDYYLPLDTEVPSFYHNSYRFPKIRSHERNSIQARREGEKRKIEAGNLDFRPPKRHKSNDYQ